MNDTYAAKEITAALLDVLKAQGLCLKEALRLIEKAEKMAESIHVPMVITVVDQGGNMVAMHRMDDSLLASISISYSKAYTAAAMKTADIGISVDTAVDVAKESADIILLEKDLMVLEQGIIEGRKTYANMIKYIKMTASSNFGNMFSVLAASALLPFLPMMSVHLIFLTLIYDLSCTAIPWDNVDEEFIAKPRKWDASSVGSFMMWIGPTSSVFDWMTYIFMYFVFCPLLFPRECCTMILPVILPAQIWYGCRRLMLQCFRRDGLSNLCGARLWSSI